MRMLAERLKEIRTAKKARQSDVANAIGVTPHAISQYENGTRLPSLDVLVILADYYGVTTDWLLGRCER